MKMNISLLLLVFSNVLFITGKAQKTIQPSLKKELDTIYVRDQQYRELLSISSRNPDSLAGVLHVRKEQLQAYLWNLQSKLDSSNISRVETLFDKYGYPGKSLVGTPTNEAAFYVVQHSNKIDKYLPIIQAAAEKDELPFHLYAMMLDRSLMAKGKEQVYGSQAMGFQFTNPATGKEEVKMFIWPIGEPSSVNERRKAAGFDQTVEENAKRLGIEYKALTLEEVRAMRSKK